MIAIIVASVSALGISIAGAWLGRLALHEKRARLVIEKTHEQEMARLQGPQRAVDEHAVAVARNLETLAKTTSTKCHDPRCVAVGNHRCHNLDCKAHRS